jgi:hypothetical protein
MNDYGVVKAGNAMMIRMGAALALLLMMPTLAVAQSDGQPQGQVAAQIMAQPDQSPATPATNAPDATPPATDATPPAPPPPAPDIAVLDSALLSIVPSDSGNTVTATTSIPYLVGKSCYNWALKFTPVEGEVVLSEELVLPGPARNWGLEGAKAQVNPQGSGAVTERRFDGRTGAASAGWCVAKDDPVGAYRYIIRQGEREVARFDFTVGDLL